jgi:hypothetical protein
LLASSQGLDNHGSYETFFEIFSHLLTGKNALFLPEGESYILLKSFRSLNYNTLPLSFLALFLNHCNLLTKTLPKVFNPLIPTP